MKKKMGMGGMHSMKGSMMENPMMKTGGPVSKSKPKMKTGGNCGTPKSLRKGK